jgi:hypothetical protein
MSETIEFGDDKPKKAATSKKATPKPELAAVPPLDLEDQVATPAEVELAESLSNTKRTMAAVTLRMAGFSYNAIADELDFSTPRMARQTVIAAIANAGSIEDNKTLREIESARLDRLLASVWKKAIDPENDEQLQYNRRAAELIEQHTRLHGLNAPSVLAITNPDAEKFNAVLQELTRATQGDVDPEGDIFELQEGPDGTFGQEEEPGDEGGA